MAHGLKSIKHQSIHSIQKHTFMKNLFLSSLLIALFTLTVTTNGTAQDSYASTSTHVEVNDEGDVKKLIITETETDNSYRFSVRFSKGKTDEIRSYLSGLLGGHDYEVGNVRQVWKHLPDGATIEGLEITLRNGHILIKAKDGCCPGDMEELKAIGEDIKSILK